MAPESPVPLVTCDKICSVRTRDVDSCVTGDSSLICAGVAHHTLHALARLGRQ